MKEQNNRRVGCAHLQKLACIAHPTVIIMVFVASVCFGEVRFERVRLGDITYEAASVFDVDNDGRLDIVSGEYWFSGPEFKEKHKICELLREQDWYDDFSDFPMDADGDGYMDIVTGGWWGETLRWRENPKGKDAEWKAHDIDKCGNIETIRFWDVDGDGQAEVIPNLPGAGLTIYKLITDETGKGTGKFSRHTIYQDKQGHGLGFGDINGDGRGDFILAGGWLEAPQECLKGKWDFHAEFNLGTASIPILVYDVNRDGRADIIAGQAHDYGLAWWEQGTDDKGGRKWIKHDIDTKRSQYHDMQLVDIDNDGEVELVTGKRYRAHLGKDPGAGDDIGVYYFEIEGGKFERVTIDYGPPSKASGVGIYFWVADINGDGYMDIIAPGKEGLYLFKNLGPGDKN